MFVCKAIFLSETSPKMARTDGMENIISSPTTPQPLDNSQLSHHTINTGSTENGDGMNSIKSEIVLSENAISIDDISTPTTQTTSTPIKSGRRKYFFLFSNLTRKKSGNIMYFRFYQT